MIIGLKSRNSSLGWGLLLLPALVLAGCSSKEERAKNYYDEGMKFLAAHDNAKAAVEFKNAVQLKKDYPDAWIELAKIAELDRNYRDEISDLQQVIELRPHELDTRLKLASLFLALGHPESALKLANEAEEDHNQDPKLLALKAVALFRLKEPNEAVANAEAALKFDPNNSIAMSVLAADRTARGDTQAALIILDKAESDTGGANLGIELQKLKIYEEAKNWSAAESLLRKLIQQYPDQPFRQQLIRIYILENRLDAAESELRAIAAEKPDDPAAELAVVRLLATSKGFFAARQELESRIQAGGKVFPYQLALAQLIIARGDYDGGEQLLKKLIADSSEPEALTARIELARIYLARKQVNDADALVSQILQKDPRNAAGITLRASVHMDQGRYNAAIDDVRIALTDQPQSTDLMVLLATAYEGSGAIELADKEYADALRTSSFSPTVGLKFVSFLRRRGAEDRAEDLLAKLAERWPQNKDILLKLARVKLAQKDWAGADALAEKIKALPGGITNANEILGAALIGQDKVNQGIDLLESAYAADPSATGPRLTLVRAYLRAKQPDKATALLQNLLQKDPSDAEAYVLLGNIQATSSSPQQAIDSYRKAIEKQPRGIAGYQALANLYLGQNNVAMAQKVIQQGLDNQPDSLELHLIWAGTLERKGDYDGAIHEYETILAKYPGSLIAINNIASLLANHRTDKASLERAQSLAALLRKSPYAQFQDTLGWVDYQSGNYKDAVPLLEQATAAMPGQADVHYHLGMSYIAVAKLDKASEQLNIALKQSPDPELLNKIRTGLKSIAAKE